MSGRRTRTEQVRLDYPTVVDRTPRIITRNPEDGQDILVSRTSWESKRPRSTIYRLFNPLSRNDIITVKEKTASKRRDSDLGPSPLRRSTTVHNRPSSPRLPAIIIQNQRPRSVSPPSIRTMPGNTGPDHVPLPPRIPSDEERRILELQRQHQERQQRERLEREGRANGRPSRQGYESNSPLEEVPRQRSRTRRPYGRPARTADNPFAESERVEKPRIIETREPSSPHRPLSRQTQNYDIVTPNETVRSRPRANEVMSTREYRDMKAVADRNFELAKAAEARCIVAQNDLETAEGKVRTFKEELISSTMRENKQKEKVQQLETKLEKLLKELDLCKREHSISSRERDVSQREADSSREQLDRERQIRRDREREDARERARRDDGDSGENGGRPRGPRRVVLRQPTTSGDRDRERRDAEPRTNYGSVFALADTDRNAGRGEEDSGMAAIERARAEAARKTRN